ncbi:hypothetical protein D4764_02G0002540 [Takifugu flavidus]|uniref:Uncharacterized protein n=1 Tax=Takifugu flavidus TaxID=433684 RepID=A0A5C6NJ11_9TELE|nr:hypothetical protein D4764_02G0002540 [Takifugu flavidus]
MAALGSGERPGAAAAQPRTAVEPRMAVEPGTASERPVARAEGPGDDGATAPKIQESSSLHWLLKEPLVHGGRLDVCSSAMPGLMGALCGSRTVTLKQLVEAAGPALAAVRTLSTVLRLRSLRLVERTLELWRRRLSVRERCLLLWFGGGRAEPDPTDIVTDFQLSPGCEEFIGPLLKALCKNKLGLHGTDNKTVYIGPCCVGPVPILLRARDCVSCVQRV